MPNRVRILTVPDGDRAELERRVRTRGALNTATGQVTDACYPRHRHQEFLKFLKKAAAAYPDWLNMAECSFSVITRQAIRRGSFTSVKELIATIGAFIDHWNDHPRPFAWTKDAHEILASIHRAKTKANALTHR
jgi:hypothetical protein